MKLSLPWRWFLGLAALLVVLLVAVNVVIDVSLPSYLVQRIRSDLERDALLARAALAGAPAGNVNDLAHRLAKETGLRITVLAKDGTVIGESDKPAADLLKIENHLYRPEVQAAILSGLGSATRHSETTGTDWMYVAASAGEAGFVRVALPLHEIAVTKSRIRRAVAGTSVVVMLLALPVALWLSRRLTQPIEGMRAMATRVAAGDFSHRAPEEGGPELQHLGAALNAMSGQLEARLRELAAEKSELQATLANMVEGVLVVDAGSRVRLANASLRRLFLLTDEATGKTVLEAFRSAPLQDLITQALAQGQASARELSFFGLEEQVFDVAVGCLRDGAGAVVVFHNITRIKQLENVRKEFVANVSHELRTPLSIIKGYVETLLDEQPPDAGTTKQFLETIQRHSRRLEMLVSDLLSISELESQQARLNLAPVSLRAEVNAVVEELGRNVAVELTDVQVRADVQRLHQVLVNLIGNAIKYTPADSKIVVSAETEGGFIKICVADNGPGIAPEHLPRIFERFYRVDKARSRELGGTGLGLAIVKHIVQAHGGRVWAESDSGKGSRFYFTLPVVSETAR